MPNEENTEITDEMQSAMKKRNWKFRLVFSLIALGFIAVIIKLFMVQVVDADKFRKMAKRQQEAKVPLRAERGDIYDRNGKLLVSTLQGVSIAVDPTLVEKKEKICASLEKSTGVPAKEYLEKINSAKGSFVWLARGLMPGETSALDTLKDRGLIKIIEARRNYLYAPLASQIIGCTGIDNKGLSGIELGWDTVLSGTSGYMIMKRDGKGNLHPSADLPVIKAEHG
jgi:cell division protein FtsI/penicillin-binding protein 2